jgi:hypothetical protein
MEKKHIQNIPHQMWCIRFEVFTVVTMKNGVFWDVTPCGSSYKSHMVQHPRRRHSLKVMYFIFETNYTTYTHCIIWIHINVGGYMWRYAVTYVHVFHSIHFQRQWWVILILFILQMHQNSVCFMREIIASLPWFHLYSLSMWTYTPWGNMKSVQKTVYTWYPMRPKISWTLLEECN